VLRPPFRVADKNAAFHQKQNVAEGRILRALGKLRIFRRRKLTLKAIKKAVHEALPVVDRDAGDNRVGNNV
jgi:hypothetical protein